jgi:hypothetical protein
MFGSSPTLPSPSYVSKLDQRQTGRPRKRENLLTGEGEEGVGEKLNHTTARMPGPLKIIQYSLNILLHSAGYDLIA